MIKDFEIENSQSCFNCYTFKFKKSYTFASSVIAKARTDYPHQAKHRLRKKLRRSQAAFAKASAVKGGISSVG